MPDAAIRLEGVGKRYALGARGGPKALRDVLGAVLRGGAAPRGEASEVWALREVSLAIAEGEAVGIIGRNGSGKSTLLKLLSRITAPSEGRITLRGRVAGLLEVGTGFHPDLTGRENVFLNGAILGMPRREIRAKFDAIVAFSELERFIDTPVRHYSSGMTVRLAFSVAAHLEPDVLLLDEVLAVGDARFQQKCLQKMDEATGRHRTLLVVSHDMAVVRRLCSRAVLLQAGRMTLVGPTEEVVTTYLGAALPSAFATDETREGPHWVSASVRGSSGAMLSTDDTLQVHLQWCVPQDTPGLRVEMRVTTRQGTTVFATFPEDAGTTSPTRHGLYHAVVAIPPHVLLAGEHAITLGLWEFGRHFDWRDDALGFSVEPGPGSIVYQGPEPHRAGVSQVACGWVVASQ